MSNALVNKAQAAGLVASTQSSPVMGVEGMDDRDGNLASIQLMQEKNKMLKAMVKAKVQAVPGMFVNTDSPLTPLAEVDFIPCFMTKLWDLYKYKGDDKEWVKRSSDENDAAFEGKRRRTEKLPDGTKLKAEVQQVISTIALVNGYPTRINFKASSLGAGKNLYSLASKAAKLEKVSLWGKRYKLTSKSDADDKGNEYYVMAVEVVGATTADEQALAESVYQGFAGRKGSLVAATDDEAPF